MSDGSDILPHAAAFDRATADAFFAAIPAKWCVTLLIDVNGHPLQLVCAKNLRAMLRRRLGEPDSAEAATPTKRVDYRELVRRVAWRRVDGEFEMDLIYIEAARLAFPAHWRRLIPDRDAHFVRIDLDDPHPDFTRESGVDKPGRTWGPFPDRAKADRWIEAMRDAFDLCRYRNILAQSPKGKACAYKQMNKCPAPCDGTIELSDYLKTVEVAVDAVRSPDETIERLTAAMKRHAANLEFEQAAKEKTRLTQLEQLRVGPYAAVRPIEAFRFLSIQPGPRKGTARLFVLTSDGVDERAGVLDASVTVDEVRSIAAGPVERSPWPSDVLLGTLCYHLGGAKTSSRFVAEANLTDTVLAEMLKAAMKQQPKAEDAEAVRETRLQV